MAESLILDNTHSKEERYKNLLPQVKALVGDEKNVIANMANVAAALRQAFGFFWVGFYLLENNSLVLGPFQGPIACTRIAFGKGVCGKTWEKEQTIIVDDVDAFPGHIACSSDSKSEIVVPVFKNKQFFAVLDVDSDSLASFDNIDQKYLEELVTLFD